MALPTSGTYNFQSITAELLIRDAFENIGITSEFMDVQKLDTARRALNLLNLEWMSKSYNLWTIESGFIPLNQGQAIYQLPNYVNSIVEMNTRTFTRQLNGLPSSPTGTAANAFDGDPYTACTQTNPNGFIDYAYSQPPGNITQTITMVGITSFTTQDYTINIRLNRHYDPNRFVTVLSIPKQTYPAGVTLWFDLPIDSTAPVIFIEEVGGATLNIQELYFVNNVQDIVMSEISQYEYQTLPNKTTQSRPNSYWLNRQFDNPSLTIWPMPDNTYFLIQYTYTKMIQDVAMLSQTIQIPARFYPAMIWGLTWRLAIKFRPEIAQQFQSIYMEAFREATIEDSETVPFQVQIDTTYY